MRPGGSKLDRLDVPIGVTLACLPVAPIMQYLLIQMNAPRWIYLILPSAFAILYPVLCYSEPFAVYGTCVMLQLFMCLRSVDVGLLSSSVVQSWTFHDYNEYFYTFYTKQIAKERQAKGLKSGSDQRVLAQDRNVKYYGRWAWKMFVQYSLYHFLIWFTQQYPRDRNPPVRQFTSPLDLEGLFNNLIFGLTFCLQLSLSKFRFKQLGILS